MAVIVGALLDIAPKLGISTPLRAKLRTDTDHASAMEAAAGFGLCWYDAHSGQILLSTHAAKLLDVQGCHHKNLDETLIHVVPEDAARLVALLSDTTTPCSGSIEARVLSAAEGMRWLRISTLPDDAQHPQLINGMLQDISQVKHAAVRERLGFELTEYLVGSHALGDAIDNAIQLICKNLGWEWGAYWAMEHSGLVQPHLACKNFWHPPDYDLTGFSQASTSLYMKAGEGLVGSVWESGEAQWVESMGNDPRFLRHARARASGLWSGYVFPVTYVSDDGVHHRPGVLEFYSSLSRQPEAQLPKLSKTIGALIAQTAGRLEKEAEIRHMAQVDELTELANRAHFYALLDRRCVRAARANTVFGLMYIDLDRFKPINDAFGHEAGNVVLRGFAARLKLVAPDDAVVGRLGGDEFAVLVPCRNDAELAHIAQQILEAARTPFEYEGIELTVSASVGISRFPDNGLTSPELLRSADAAMYRVKQNGRNNSDVFSTSSPNLLAQQQASIAQRLAIETELHHALQDNALFLAYQPIFDIASGSMHAVEALVRWRRQDGTLVPPDLFIPIAEQSHLIVEIDQWVMAQACRDLATLRAAGFDGLKVHVNMAATEFANSALPEELRQLTASLGVDPSNISLELTEGMLMKHPEQVVRVMHDLRKLGFEISLDDFGMGHSSLSMLKNLPISSMKVDRSFVRDLPTQERDRAIVNTIVGLGQHMRLDVIAEGVETLPQLAVLREAGCTLIQGFLLSRPLSLQDLLVQFPEGKSPA
ncbi:EAL domain-containing protein [Rhodoferax saidenbachensis]|uniref:Diguanylate cyclase (GGDEF)-like protein n=1 Tax=Rhodoferax saidenbachensis TaxID=1484693 RepID=A0ABU1ZHY3_9BURK|nr:EAL domain-containing protein [Rhodoferax saidenbachensis]MDR7305093.1 diguanylate cyclase (GGDEF)-like protein [Rhodoferax saidenbachensis]